MPAKNSVKIYLPDSYYHLYNRGVEKGLIYRDEQDYSVFLSYLKTYLLPQREKQLLERLSNPVLGYKEREQILRELRLKNFFNEIKLLSYCLMPNHFHFLVKQVSANSIDEFINSLGIRYVMYFNKKYKRIGPMFQDVYKAVSIESEEQLLYLTSYIHRNGYNPKLASKVDGFRAFRAWFVQPSSYPEYLGQRKTEWVHPEEILSFFSKTNPKLSYRSFVEQNDDISPIQKLILDL